MKIQVFYFKLVFLLIIGTGLIHAQTHEADSGFFHQSFGDLSDELQIAREEGKKGVFVMFDDKDCPWCQKMKTTVLNQKEVQDYYRKFFRIIRVDTNGDALITDFDGIETTEKDFAEKSRVRATPVIVFYDLQGKPINRYIGATRNVQEFMWMGEFVVDEHYKTQSFPIYKRKKKNGEI